MFFWICLGFSYVINSVASQSCEVHNTSGSGTDYERFVAINFDYLVIGGGTAGLALASRLAENKELQVGVIEAGIFHPNDPLIDVPINTGHASGNITYDWNLVTVPQPGAGQRSIAAPRGKVLGGSSALNFLAFNRASKIEYDSWDSFAPGSGWNWKGLQPYLDKAATIFPDQINPFPGIAPNTPTADNSGFQGPIQSSINDVYADSVFPYVEALNAIGIPTNANPENGSTSGASNSRVSVDRKLGIRSYAAPGYYCRSASLDNFHVLMDAQATKVLFKNDKKGLKATGVQFTANSRNLFASAKKEVILSAGVYQTPQLLELSGIGNKTHLEKLGIPTLVDLQSVGENLQDHLAVIAEFQLKPGIVTFDELRNNATFAAEQANLYNTSRTGFLAATNSALAFLSLPSFLDSEAIKSLLDIFDEAVTHSQPSSLQKKQYAVQREWLQKGIVPQLESILFSSGTISSAVNESYVSVLACAMHQVGRGSVHINTTQPLAPPVINPKWLLNDFDVALLLEGLKFSQRLGGVSPLADIIDHMTAPGAQNDTALVDFIRQTVGSSQHPMGTAAMGPRESGGVVDGQLKVYGTTNLRICDASIFPVTIAAHLQSTVYAIAEKLADSIKHGK